MEMDLARLRAVIIGTYPELEGSEFQLLTKGWDSVAVDVDGRLIFKFPRTAAGEGALLREASLLAVVRPAVTIPVPDLTVHRGSLLFSRHRKIAGEYLESRDYEELPETARQELGARLGRFYAEIHRLDVDRMKRAGAGPIGAWLAPDEMRRKALPALPADLRSDAEQMISAYEMLPPDPFGTVYGFFDGHGWNMAFDHSAGRLNGIYDFGDSGIGPLHQDFIYSNFISPDLTDRVLDSYEVITGCRLDRRRIDLLTGVHRLSELAFLADDPEHLPMMIAHVESWMHR